MKTFAMGMLILASLLGMATTATAATITGTVYDGLSLEAQKNSIVTIDTTPAQTKVSKDGTYSFEAGDGTFELHAEYRENGIILQRVEQSITIQGEGTYTIDLIMLPDLGDVPQEPLPNEEKELTIWDQLVAGPLAWLLLLGIVLAAGGFAVVNTRRNVWKAKKDSHEKKENDDVKQENEETPPPKEIELDKYAYEIIDHLKRGGNRLTQKELREKVTIGEAKVSLVVSELESEKIVKKIKKGRANIIVLTEKGMTLAEKKTSDEKQTLPE